MTVYLVFGSRRTLHKGVQLAVGKLATLEACNADDATRREVYTDLSVAKGAAKRSCKRCFVVPA